jgi:glucan phosphorylase
MPNSSHTDWFEQFKTSKEYESFQKKPVAYFCAEYALDSNLPTYAGGLGVLAGDHVREAAARGFPIVSVGLFYKKAQSVLSLGEGQKSEKLKILTDEKGEEITVSMPFEGRNVCIRVWQWQENDASVYLLDTDIDKNDPRDREITYELYSENRHTRLKQEILLGIGGFRVLARLGLHPTVYHLNEGHSAFLALELVRHEMEHQKVGFKEACGFAKKHVVFTNHTLVPAGQEQFASQAVAELIEPCAMEICLNKWEIVKLGSLEDDPDIFSMTNMSFQLSTKSNSVSEMHLEKARAIWPDYKMENITNGIFTARWDKVGEVSLGGIQDKHRENKQKLLGLVKERTGEEWGEADLVFAWARRMVSYKQPLLILDNLEKISEVIRNSPAKVRIVFSGPTGDGENLFVNEIKKIAEEKLKGSVAFIPNYNTEVAEILTAGADVWLNTPISGNEACGTSGMKALLNGTLNLSTEDGWVGEVNADDIGWVVNDSQNGEEMRTVIEKEIIPMYGEYLKNPATSVWGEKMDRGRALVLENFSTTRMLREYIEKFYLPTMGQKHRHKID